MSDQFWQINDFTEQIKLALEKKSGVPESLHYNTVDKWFKALERERVHYVNREVETQKKVYTELDLQVALTFKDLREKGFRVNGVINEIPKRCELRPFPDKSEEESDALPVDHQDIFDQFKELLKEYSDQESSKQREFMNAQNKRIKNLEDELQKLQRQLPAPNDDEDEEEKVMDIIKRERNKRMVLENEALTKWEQKPVAERFIKTGLFSKSEDITKRDRFIKQYINERLNES